MRIFKTLFVPMAMAAASILAPGGANAAIISSGSLDSDNGEIIFGGSYSEFEISWVIETTATPGVLHYSYTVTEGGLTPRPSVSHFILELCESITGESDAFSGPFTNSNNPFPMGDLSFGNQSTMPANPGWPVGVTIWGVKFDALSDGTTTFEFDSNQSPELGSFYAKGGSTSFAYNTGLADPDGAFIMTPGCETVIVPVPASLPMGLAGIGLVAFRRSRKKA